MAVLDGYHERVAIMEYDAKLPRRVAEQAARDAMGFSIRERLDQLGVIWSL